MKSQAAIGLNLIILGTVLSQPICCIQPHQRFLISGYHDQVEPIDNPPLNPGSPDERVPAGTHKSYSLAIVSKTKSLARVEDEPTPPKEQTPGGSRWIAFMTPTFKPIASRATAVTPLDASLLFR